MNLDSLSLDEQEQYLRMELARRANACLELLDRHKNFAYTRSKFQAPADNVNSKPPSVLPSNDPTQFYPPLSAALSIARFFKTSTDRRVSSLSSDAGFMDRLDVALQAGIDKTNKVFKCPFGLAVLLSSLLCQMAVENSAVKLDVLTNNTDVLRAVTVPWALVPETTTRTILEASVPLTTQSDTGIRTDGSPFQLLQQLTGLGTFKPYYLLNSGVIHDLIDLGSSPTLLAATTGVSAPATNAALTGHVLAAQLLERQFTFSDGDVIESQVKAVSIKPLKLNDVQFSVLAGRFDANRVVPQLGVSTSALGQDVLSSLNDNSDALGYIRWALALEATAFKAEPSQLVVTPGSSVYSLVNQLISEDLADLPVYAIHCSKLLAKLNGEAPTSPVRKSIATALNEQLALVGSIFATLGRFVGAEQHQVDQRALVKLLINTVNSLLTAIEIQLEAPKPARVLVALTKSFASLFLSIGASCDPEWDLNSVSLLEKLAVDQGSKGNPDSTQKTDFQLDAEACITNVILTIIKSAWFSANMGTVIPVNLINTLLQAGKLASTAASSGEKVQEQAVAPQQQQQQQQQQQEQQQQLVQWFMEQRIVIGNTYNQLQAATALYATKYDVVQSVTGVLAALETLAAETKDAAAAAEIPHSTALVKAAKFELEQVTQPYIQLSQTYQYLSEQYQAYARYYPDIEAYAARYAQFFKKKCVIYKFIIYIP